ncbi:uncharacterized protein LOC130774989 [Actinidia eriantha]|uniref:uncharacterized protein LOC130774989 n=1 Tax=Actinidia eriantha TaxID=165200 RepID=UPI002586611E|nr:uncharacterized protein LOC130774989 [Actinidia eriantha]XP_057489018.1 uncharacterized protein LOC130774989 [Actinidia eriantha]XP_057489019.1 uncharacterized protein LOC130774989 [Actinidia eriantha]XP_057489020.1 uncharacterized protein LOC130774989 [Actinidia eriantha]
MESQQSEQSNPNGGKAGKEKQQRRLWTSKEEEALLVAMLDCFGDKWKGHNGFKPGYFTMVEKELQKLLPGTTLRAKPNIESKVKGWKEKYGLLADMIRISGFAWNHARQCVEVDDTTVWEEYERTHKGVSGMNGKAFPMFEDWQTLFGHDRATGEMAEDAPEVPDETHVQTPGLDDTWNDCYSPKYASGEPWFQDGIFVDATGNDPIDNINPSTPRGNINPSTPRGNINPSTPRGNVNVNPSSTRRGNVNPSNPRGDGNPSIPIPNIPVPERPKKKAKLDALNEMMKGFISQNNAHMEKLTNALGYDKELSNKRKSVFSELMKLDMDEMDRFKVNNIIVGGEERLDAFFGIPDHMKQRWVEGVLDGKVTF